MDSEKEAKRDPGIFDLDPELYDVVRSGYPAALFESIVELASLYPGDRLLEIGCGTGKATSWFAERGYSVTAVEKGPSLSDFARRRFAAMGNVSVVNTPFETYCDSSKYNLVYAGSSFHWIDRDVAFSKCASHLCSGGHLALFWNDLIITDISRRKTQLVEKAYAQILPEWHDRFIGYNADAVSEEREKAISESGFFKTPITLDFPFTETYTPSGYTLFLSTTSDHGALGGTTRRQLFGEIERIIGEECGGTFTKEYRTSLFLAEKV